MEDNRKIKKDNVEDILALSAVQTGILYEYLIREDKELYISQLSLCLKGEINVTILIQALQKVCDHNEMLRCVFRWEGLQNPIQIIFKNYSIPFDRYVLEEMPLPEAEQRAEELKENQRCFGIDIRTAPLKVQLFQYKNGRSELVLTWHHIAYDGWSNMILIREILQSYESMIHGEEVIVSEKANYKDYIKLCNKAENADESKKFWQGYFQEHQIKDARLSEIESRKKTIITQRYSFKLDKEMMNRLMAYQQKHRVTVADLIYTAWGILIYKYTGIDSFTIGAAYSGRNMDIKKVDKTIGLFINTLPLKIVIEDSMPIAEVLNCVKQNKAKMLNYEMGNLIEIKKYAGIKSEESLFRSLVVVENYPVEMDKWLNKREGTLHIESYCSKEKNNYELVVGILPPEQDTFLIQYDKDLYTEKYIKRMADYLQNLLDIILESTDCMLIEDIDMYTSKEIEAMEQEAYQLSVCGENKGELLNGLTGELYIAVNRTQTAETEEDIQDDTINEIEEKLSMIWKNILHLKNINTKRKFLELGGNSTLFLRMVADIERIYPGIITVADAFTYPTIRELGNLIHERVNQSKESVKVEFQDMKEYSSRLMEKYFIVERTDNRNYSTMVYDFEEETCQEIRKASDYLQISEPSIILAAFLQGIYRASYDRKAIVQFIGGLDETVSVIEQGCERDLDWSHYLKEVDETYQAENSLFHMKNMEEEPLRKMDQRVMALFYDMNCYQFKQEILMIYDMVLGISLSDEEISLIYRFNNQNLNKALMIDLFDEMIDDIYMILAEILAM